ncbi:MAG: acyl-CoA dehydrogenase [Deltaproteobacteria bacterium]|nr:acyl-CoA dehydrogenase [Deltaproteobacteria bacterium]
MATAETEPDHGSDWQLPYEGFHMNTTAVLDGDEWVINGVKQWSSGAGRAKLYRVLARTSEGNAYIFVPSDTPGLSVHHVNDKLGERLCPNAGMAFDNVRVPKENLESMLGESKVGLDVRSRIMRASNAYAAACNVGVGRAAYEAALAYAKTRVQGGRRIIENQIIGAMLADMFIELEAARLLYWKAAWAADHDESYEGDLFRDCQESHRTGP